MLDLLANRCLASGTNAMTEQHYTVYTLKTAGHEGFLIMLPIYLDHIFHPNLTVIQSNKKHIPRMYTIGQAVESIVTVIKANHYY